jgi:hypothetical protein
MDCKVNTDTSSEMATKPEKPMVGSRVPQEGANQINAVAHEKGCKSAHIVYEAITLYLDKTDVKILATHEGRITALEERLSRLGNKFIKAKFRQFKILQS